MRILLILPLFAFLNGVAQEQVKYVRKQITQNDISVKWFYYKNVPEDSPDMIEVSSKDKKKIIYEATDIITDVAIKNKSIIIKVYQPQDALVITKQVDKSIFGYLIVLDSKTTQEEQRRIPRGVKEGF